MDVEDSVMSIKGFKFSLETPLKIRKIRKTQLESDLMDAKNKLDAGIKMLESLKREERYIYSGFEALVCNGVQIKDYKIQKVYLENLAERIYIQQKENEILEKRYRDLLEKMIRLMKEIDKLEDLKKDKFKEFLREIEKQEQKELEERINYNSSFQGGLTYG
ncbi:MAG: hypothetical protein GX054_07175 [Clostridiales bacterium]|nr:hypothetical protein [Clostridiales bacterium]